MRDSTEGEEGREEVGTSREQQTEREREREKWSSKSLKNTVQTSLYFATYLELRM